MKKGVNSCSDVKKGLNTCGHLRHKETSAGLCSSHRDKGGKGGGG